MSVVYRGVARIFQREEGGGGHTGSNNIVMAFSPRNIVGCLLKKRLAKGTSLPTSFISILIVVVPWAGIKKQTKTKNIITDHNQLRPCFYHLGNESQVKSCPQASMYSREH